MSLSRLDHLYKQIILDHNRFPHNRGIEPKAGAHVVEFNNPTCGDVLQLQVEVNDEGVITDAHFDGHGCSISMASASMMTLVVVGKTVDDALVLCQDFFDLVQGKDGVDEEALGDAALLSGVAKYPSRIKCATLSWKALEQAIQP